VTRCFEEKLTKCAEFRQILTTIFRRHENKDRKRTHLELGTMPSELCMAQSHVASNHNNKENEEMRQVIQAHDDRVD
jgi:hypothetical protein